MDLASALRFFAIPDPVPVKELLVDILILLLPALVAPVSMTDVDPAVDIMVLLAPTELTVGGWALVLPPVLLVPNTESEFTTIVSVKLDVVNLAIASFDRSSLLLPVCSCGGLMISVVGMAAGERDAARAEEAAAEDICARVLSCLLAPFS